MTELSKKVNTAIDALRAFEPSDGYFLCYSGGKDSDVIRILAGLAGVKHEIHHSLTTVDAPETIAYIKTIPGVIIDKARYNDGHHKTMWNLIVHKGLPPTRLMRYCCEHLKEWNGKGRLKITGVRAAESRGRAENGGDIKILGKPRTTQKYMEREDIQHSITKQGGIILNFDNDGARRAVEHCFRTTCTMINPILTWTSDDVWEFLNYYGCTANPMYKCGEKRVGCIGCPLAGKKAQLEEFKRYPAYYENYIRAFDKMLKTREEKGKTFTKMTWKTGEDVMNWWVGDLL